VSLLRVRLERFDDALAGRRRRGGRPSWEGQPDVLPWLDRPDALASVAAMADDERRALLEQWVRDGYVIVDDVVAARDLDELCHAMDSVWSAERPYGNLVVNDVQSSDGTRSNLAHRALLDLTPGERASLQVASRWRIHEFEQSHVAALRVYANQPLRRLATTILGRPARPVASITFMYGSEQALHQDMAVFHTWPRNHLLGAWIACEDVSQECGPLVFYPGSHVEPMFGEFDRYPATNLHTADDARAARYQHWIDAVAERYERREFLPRKGQVLLWHPMLIHGGAPVIDVALTRRSYVVHYATRGALRIHDRWDNPRW
jgi:ectoine hydroxylase-related dioxygenase (phytanoyl-CoA dioxygenase family)